MNPSITIMDLTATKELTDTHIRRYCEERKANALHINPRYALLWESIESLLLAGGKRLRPHLLITAYFGYAKAGHVETILPAAIAQELLHAAMLIHDDIIDRDTIRYGIPNISGQYDNTYEPFIDDTTERSHMSLSAALLAGDILLSDAHRLLCSVELPKELVTQATNILSQSVFEAVGGELLDTEVTFLPMGTITAETIAKLKTASYSFRSPLTIGATLAGAPKEEIHLLTQLSEYFGVGYQLQDDLLGIFGDERETGKSNTSDIIEGKRTFLIEQFEAIASTQQREQFFSIFHRADATDGELEQARALLDLSGAKQSVEKRINTLREAAYKLIAQLSINEQSQQALRNVFTLY